MDKLLKELLEAPGISGCEEAVAEIMKRELSKSCDEVKIDNFGNVFARKGNGKKKIMIIFLLEFVTAMVNKDT